MRRLVAILLFCVLGSAGKSFALPPCPEDQNQRFHNCFGTYTTATGSKYVGEFKSNKWHGQGTLTWTDGAKYVGEWKDSKKHGRGTYTWASGNKYVGEFKGNKRHGLGTFTWANGNKYVGEFKDNNLHGQGTFTWANGNKYVGEFKDGKNHGRGSLTFTDGRKYVGEFKHGKSHGQGTYTLASGDKYVGEFKNDNYHGQGTYTKPSGDKYIGEWKDNKFHGQGISTWLNGNKYVGEWKDGKKHGLGTHISSFGDKYVGKFKDDQMHGQGTFIWADGDKYVGEFKDDHKHGLGTHTYGKGEFHGSKYVGEMKFGYQWQVEEYNALGEVTRIVSNGLPAPVCDGNPASSQGTGFAVSRHHVVTSAHVLYCCKRVTVRDLESCHTKTFKVGTIVATEQRSDLGLLRLDKTVKHHATLRSGKELQLGEVVSTYDTKPEVDSCPQYVMGQGKVTKLNWMPDDSRLMVHESPTRAGSSGGPVLDASGHIVGVSAMGSELNPTDSQAVKSYLLEAFLKTNRVEYNTAPSAERLSQSELKERSDRFTLIVECSIGN